jgi:hypothetical protein
MIDSSHTPENFVVEDEPAGTIGQALDRIVSSPSRAPVVKKRLDFPRQSVTASKFTTNREILEDPSKAKVAMNYEPEVKVDPSAFQDPDLPYDEVFAQPETRLAKIPVKETVPAQAVVPAAKVEPASPVASRQEFSLGTGQGANLPPQPVQEEILDPVIHVAPVAPEPVMEEEPEPGPKVIIRREVAPAKPTMTRIVEKAAVPERQPVASGAELDLFMRESEKVENRTVQCKPDTWEKLLEISKRTGCSPSDLASQAVMSVAMAIRDAGFEFSLPMEVEYTRKA